MDQNKKKLIVVKQHMGQSTDYIKVLVGVLVDGEMLKSYLYFNYYHFDHTDAENQYLGKYSKAITPSEFADHFESPPDKSEETDDEIYDGSISTLGDNSSLSKSLQPPISATKRIATQKIPVTKWCPGCKSNLPNTDFYRNRSKSDGLQSYCKACHIIRYI